MQGAYNVKDYSLFINLFITILSISWAHMTWEVCDSLKNVENNIQFNKT